MRVVPFGPAALLVEMAGGHSEVTAAWRRLSASAPAGVEDVVAGARSVLVRWSGADPSTAAGVRSWLIAALEEPQPPGRGTPRTHRIPVLYDGEDLGEISRLCRLPTEEVVRRHAGAEYTVAFLGFSPGFGYLVGGDPGLRLPRRDSPRRRVPAGAVALADDMCAVYPSASPGGWRLLGRTDAVLFDQRRRPPALLAPGDRVRFRPVARLGGRATGGRDVTGAGGTAPGGDGSRTPDTAARGEVEVLHAGPLTTVQDLGRPGWAHVGVPRAGAADRASFVLANRAVGNPDDLPALEMTVSGPALRFAFPGLLAVRGARGPVSVDGVELDASHAPLRYDAGSVVEIGVFRAGLRAYLAVAGGFRAGRVLGSVSRDTLSGLGPAPLAAGDRLGIGPPGQPTGWSPGKRTGGPDVRPTPLPARAEPVVVAVGPGPRRDWIAGAEAALLGSWRVSPDSDRSGLRLEGGKVPWSRTEEAPAEGTVPGAVQVPAGGAPIVLLANHGATGGYPSVAVVEPPDVDRLAQCPPGQEVRLVPGPGW